MWQFGVIGILVSACATHGALPGSPPAAQPEGWNGLATSVNTYCGADDAVLRFAKASNHFRADDSSLSLDVKGTDHTRACTACIAADRAVRVFAPLALDAARQTELAARLRAFAPIMTPERARAAADEIDDVVAKCTDARAAADAGSDESVARACRAVDSASGAIGEVSGGRAISETADGCLVYEGFGMVESSAEQALENAVSAGVPVEIARREADRLLADLVHAARDGRSSIGK